MLYKTSRGHLSGGPVIKNPPHNAGDVGSVPGLGTKIPHSVELLLSPSTLTREFMHHSERPHVPQLRSDVLVLKEDGNNLRYT